MGATMWEYRVIYLYHDEFEREFNRWGGECWELITITQKEDLYQCFFKRRKVTPLDNPFANEEIEVETVRLNKERGSLNIGPFNTTPDTDRIRISVKDRQGFSFDALT